MMRMKYFAAALVVVLIFILLNCLFIDQSIEGEITRSYQGKFKERVSEVEIIEHVEVADTTIASFSYMDSKNNLDYGIAVYRIVEDNEIDVQYVRRAKGLIQRARDTYIFHHGVTTVEGYIPVIGVFTTSEDVCFLEVTINEESILYNVPKNKPRLIVVPYDKKVRKFAYNILDENGEIVPY